MKSIMQVSLVVALMCIAFAALTGCSSTSEDELAARRAEALRKERELQREMREKLRQEALRKAQEEQQAAQVEKAQKQDYLKVVDTLKASSQPLSAIAVSLDGKLLACGTARGQLKVFEIGGGIKAAAAEHTEAIRAMAFSQDSSILFTGGADETLVIWDMTAGKARKKIRDFFLTVGGVAVSSEGNTVAAGDGKRVLVLDEGGTTKKKLRSKAYGIGAAQFIPGRKWLATGSRGGLVEIWDTASGQLRHTMRRHSGAVCCLAGEASGKNVLSGDTDGLVVLWDVESGKPVRVYEGHRKSISGVQFLPGTGHFASSDRGGWLYIWDIATSKIVARARIGENNSVTSLALSPNEKKLYAACDDGTVAVLEFNHNK
jgi:WD40 repeat protein